MKLKLMEMNEISRTGKKFKTYMLTHNENLRLVKELVNVTDRNNAVAIVRNAYPTATIALNYFVEGRRVIETV